MIPPFLKNFSLSTILGLAFGVLLAGYAVFAFNPPTQAPPAGNVGAPINTGSVPQVKSGGLSVGSLLVGGGLKLGNYTTKPVCDASLTGNLIFDTSANKPYVCSSGGAWKPLDSYAYGQSTYYSYGQSAYAPAAKTCGAPGVIDPAPLKQSTLDSACSSYCGTFTATRTCTDPSPFATSSTLPTFNFSTCTKSGNFEATHSLAKCRVGCEQSSGPYDPPACIGTQIYTTTCTCS